MEKKGRTVVWGHRGSPEKRVENTVPSFLMAVEDGADGVELDVYLSNDGVVTVFHDSTLKRLAGVESHVGAMPFAELQRLDLTAGSLSPGRIPSLQEVYETLPSKLLFNIELKGWGTDPDGLEAAVVDIIKRFNALERTIISSFSPVRLRRIRGVEPSLRRAFLHAGSLANVPDRTLLRVAGRIEGLHPEHRQTDEDYLANARARGLFVNPWTVDEDSEMQRLIELGVDGIITNRPSSARKLIG